jgi:hypothetical protein
MKAFRPFVFLGIFSLFLFGCTGPPIPQEVKQAEILEHDLWGIGGPLYAPQEYQRYKSALRKAKDDPDFRADLYIYHNATAIMNKVSGTTLSKVTNIPLDVILEEERRMQEAEKHSVEEPSVSAFVRRIEEERKAAGADRDRK